VKVIEDRRDELSGEIERLSAWRSALAPLADDVRDAIALTRSSLQELPTRLAEAVSATNAAVRVLDGRLEELSRAGDRELSGATGSAEPAAETAAPAEEGEPQEPEVREDRIELPEAERVAPWTSAPGGWS
jgi:hypothetical protein